MEAFNREQFGDGTGTHMGVWNVYRRLRMMYGERAALSFDANRPKGSTVRLTIPDGGADQELEEELHA